VRPLVFALVIDEDDVCYDSASFSIEVHDFDAIVAGMSYMDVEITVQVSSVMDDDVSLDPHDTPHASHYVHCPLLPLTIIICPLLIFIICFRGMCLTVWTL